MRIITCASYYSTGSSAITNLFSECDNVCSLGEYEYRFLQDPDGIADLEYNVVENNNRHNTSDSIKRFKRFMETQKKLGYGGYDVFGSVFDEATNQFINDITELQTRTWWNKDRLDKGRLFCMLDRTYSFIKRLLKHELNTEVRYSLLSNREMAYYSAIDSNYFLTCVKKYVDTLFSSVNYDNMPFIMVDQLVPPTNTNRFIRYFNDVKVIVTERDPRDIYLLEKKEWKWGVIPVNDVTEYVKWFKITRKYSHPQNEDSTKVLRVRFEDLIYKYSETKKRLFEFVGIDEINHTSPLTQFDPTKSIRNTNVANRYPGFEKELTYIEENLSDYLYDFPGE